MTKNKITFNASDVAGAIQLEAKRIVMAIDAFAAGAPFPSAQSMQAVIERIAELNEQLLDYERTYIAMEVFHALETLEADRIPCYVRCAEVLRKVYGELELRPKWDGGFEAARRFAMDIIEDHLDTGVLIEMIAEALVNAFDSGVLAEHKAREDPEMKRVIFTKLLREHGIGIASLEEMEAYTIAVARGELKPAKDEPKLWFTSIESMVRSLKRDYKK